MPQPSALAQALLQRAGCVPKPKRTITMQYHPDPFDARVGVWWPVSQPGDNRPAPTKRINVLRGMMRYLNLFNRKEK